MINYIDPLKIKLVGADGLPRLFAAISTDSLKASFTKHPFEARASPPPDWLPDAYGVAWYSSGGWAVRREALDEGVSGALASVEGKAVLSHVRPISMGPLMDENIMPFIDGDWAFAHHGFIDRAAVVELLDLDSKRLLKGSTDSEAYFRLLIQEIRRRRDPVMGMTAAVYKLEDVGYFTSLNSVLSDGKRLYVLRYVRSDEKRYALYMARVEDSSLRINSRLSLFTVEASVKGRGYVFSTRPAGEGAELVPNKVIVVINEKMEEEIIPL